MRAVGSRMMLDNNQWAEVGLHDGALGTIVDLVYKNDSDPYTGVQPRAAIVRFDTFVSDNVEKPFATTETETHLRTAAIPLVTNRWQLNSGKMLARTALPL